MGSSRIRRAIAPIAVLVALAVAPVAAASAATLNLTFPGSGQGVVYSVGGYVSCSTSCSVPVAVGTSLQLVEGQGGRSEFVGWTGPCSGFSVSCTFTVEGDTEVGAEFVPGHFCAFDNVSIDRRRGSARQGVVIGNPGLVRWFGAGMRPGRRELPGPFLDEKVVFPVIPTGATRRILRRQGQDRLTVKVTFTPFGGRPKTIERQLTLRLAAGRRD
jgi:hypothetical protein